MDAVQLPELPKRGRKSRINIEEAHSLLHKTKNTKMKKALKYLDKNIKDPKVKNAITSKLNRDKKKAERQKMEDLNTQLQRELAQADQNQQELKRKNEELQLELNRVKSQSSAMFLMGHCNDPLASYNPQSHAMFIRCNNAVTTAQCEMALKEVVTRLNNIHGYPPLYNNYNNNAQLYEWSMQLTLTPTAVSPPLPPDLEWISQQELMMFNNQMDIELYDYNSDNLDSQLDLYPDPVDYSYYY